MQYGIAGFNVRHNTLRSFHRRSCQPVTRPVQKASLNRIKPQPSYDTKTVIMRQHIKHMSNLPLH